MEEEGPQAMPRLPHESLLQAEAALRGVPIQQRYAKWQHDCHTLMRTVAFKAYVSVASGDRPPPVISEDSCWPADGVVDGVREPWLAEATKLKGEMEAVVLLRANHYADSVVRIVQNFERLVLRRESGSPTATHHATKLYLRVLLELFRKRMQKPLVLVAPMLEHPLSAEQHDDLAAVRANCRRFIVYNNRGLVPLESARILESYVLKQEGLVSDGTIGMTATGLIASIIPKCIPTLPPECLEPGLGQPQATPDRFGRPAVAYPAGSEPTGGHLAFQCSHWDQTLLNVQHELEGVLAPARRLSPRQSRRSSAGAGAPPSVRYSSISMDGAGGVELAQRKLSCSITSTRWEGGRIQREALHPDADVATLFCGAAVPQALSAGSSDSAAAALVDTSAASALMRLHHGSKRPSESTAQAEERQQPSAKRRRLSGGGTSCSSAVQPAQGSKDGDGNAPPLYLVDATMPNYGPDHPADAPGMACKIDELANTAMPPFLCTSSPDNLLRFMQVESTGVATWSGYLNLRGVAYTGMHQETVNMSAINLGKGDLVVQVVSNLRHQRMAQRLHTALLGGYARHQGLLPPHMYLMEGVDLVMHARDLGYAEAVEFPEDSMHAVITWADATCYPACVKVACNVASLRSGVLPIYWNAQLLDAYKAVIPEEGTRDDGSDAWLQSSYLLRTPCTIAEKLVAMRDGSWPPWKEEYLPEVREQLCLAREEWMMKLEARKAKRAEQLFKQPQVEQQQEEEEELSGLAAVEVLVVRCAEKLLDVARGRVGEGASWSGSVPNRHAAAVALANLLSALIHMWQRAQSEKPDPSSFRAARRADEPMFSWEYLRSLVKRVQEHSMVKEVLDTGDATTMPASAEAALLNVEEPDPDAVATAVRSPYLHDAYSRGGPQLREALLDAARRMKKKDMAGLPPAVLCSHRLLCVMREVDLLRSQQEAVDLKALMVLRRRRARLDDRRDQLSKRLAARHDWVLEAEVGGRAPPNPGIGPD